MKYIVEYNEFGFADFTNNSDGEIDVSYDFGKHEDFKKFLEDNGVLKNYVINFYYETDNNWRYKKWPNYHDDNYDVKDFLDNTNPKHFIENAFEINSTTDKVIWDNLNNMWVRKIK
jgi:hypothetical protein